MLVFLYFCGTVVNYHEHYLSAISRPITSMLGYCVCLKPGKHWPLGPRIYKSGNLAVQYSVRAKYKFPLNFIILNNKKAQRMR